MRKKIDQLPEIVHAPDIKSKVPQKQLAKIGAISLAFNELEAVVDEMFFIALNLHGSLGFEVSGRINGLEGKVEIIKEAFKPALAGEDSKTLAVALGKGEFGLLKKFRDGIIHVRQVDVSKGTGLTVKDRGAMYSILIIDDVLDTAYELIVALCKELIVFLRLCQISKLLKLFEQDDLDDLNKQPLEQEIRDCRAQALEHRNHRKSLLQGRKFPSEHEFDQAVNEHRQALARRPTGLAIDTLPVLQGLTGLAGGLVPQRPQWIPPPAQDGPVPLPPKNKKKK